MTFRGDKIFFLQENIFSYKEYPSILIILAKSICKDVRRCKFEYVRCEKSLRVKEERGEIISGKFSTKIK